MIKTNHFSWTLSDLGDTLCFGENLTKIYPSINLLLLTGPLGAGKTSLVKGIAIGIGINEPVTSPTFALAQHYLSGHRPLVHMDLYRLENPALANELFLQEEEEANSINALLIVEWPERLSLSLPEAWRGDLQQSKTGERIFQLHAPLEEERN